MIFLSSCRNIVHRAVSSLALVGLLEAVCRTFGTILFASAYFAEFEDMLRESCEYLLPASAAALTIDDKHLVLFGLRVALAACRSQVPRHAPMHISVLVRVDFQSCMVRSPYLCPTVSCCI
jgi:hypothetical protein